jgi:hypothetical protein
MRTVSISALTLLSLFAFSFVPSFARLSAAEDTLTVDTDNNPKGTKAILTWLKAHGVAAVSLNKETIKITGEKGLNVAISPKLNAEGMDRIVGNIFLTLKDEAKEDEAALNALVTQLNTDYNVGTFSLDNDKDLLFTSQMTFVDELSIDHVKAFVTWIEGTLLQVARANEKLKAAAK